MAGVIRDFQVNYLPLQSHWDYFTLEELFRDIQSKIKHFGVEGRE